jgi:hypothetical protein
MKYIFLTFLFTVAAFITEAQDTLTVLQYNLLNYGNNTGYCNSNNNNISNKDNYIKTIVHYINPDIFTVNEISESPAIHQRLLDNSLNTGWTNYYKMADFKKIANSDIVSMLYYNSKKLRYYSTSIAQSYIRDIIIFKLYYYSNDLSQGDTVFINCIVAHLKAGSGTSNSNKRKIMAQNLMNYLSNHQDGMNYMLMGDFNVYTDQEPAFQLFVNNSNANIRFNDPVNRMGDWNNNGRYADVHTQSTHASSNNCASSGGMDDRFDFILISNDIKNKNHSVSYLNNSYKAVGQDGNHFNKSINAAPVNSSVPSNVLNALYNNSDHLPVTLKLKIDKTLGIDEYKNYDFYSIKFNNPVSQFLNLKINSKTEGKVRVKITELTGKITVNKTYNLKKGDNSISLAVGSLAKGLYLLSFTDDNNRTVTKKFIKR